MALCCCSMETSRLKPAQQHGVQPPHPAQAAAQTEHRSPMLHPWVNPSASDISHASSSALHSSTRQSDIYIYVPFFPRPLSGETLRIFHMNMQCSKTLNALSKISSSDIGCAQSSMEVDQSTRSHFTGHAVAHRSCSRTPVCLGRESIKSQT